MLDLAAGVPFYSFGPYVRGPTFATNSAASLNLSIRTKLKSQVAFPMDVVTTKLIYLTVKTYEN